MTTQNKVTQNSEEKKMGIISPKTMIYPSAFKHIQTNKQFERHAISFHPYNSAAHKMSQNLLHYRTHKFSTFRFLRSTKNFSEPTSLRMNI